MSSLIRNEIRVSHYSNNKAVQSNHYPKACKAILNLDDAEIAYQEISQWPNYSVTPLHELNGIAGKLNIAKIWYKDEATRFGLGSFKALGGAYAVFVQLKNSILKQTGELANIESMIKGDYAAILSTIVVTCATDGNHGKSVAWGASLFGCRSVIYIHNLVSKGREKAITLLGADVIRCNGNFDDSVKRASVDAKEFGRIIVSDTSYEGYMEIPKYVALGYTVMVKEIVKQLEDEIPTHVFLQGGVGGLASAVEKEIVRENISSGLSGAVA